MTGSRGYALVDDGQTAALAGAARGVLADGGALVLECHAEGAAALAGLLDVLGSRPGYDHA